MRSNCSACEISVISNRQHSRKPAPRGVAYHRRSLASTRHADTHDSIDTLSNLFETIKAPAVARRFKRSAP